MLRGKETFKPCESVVDPAPYIDACKYDLCLDGNNLHREVFRCRAIAAYAFACAAKGVILNWMESEELRDVKQACQNNTYGICSGGAFYTEKAPTKNRTCRELSMKVHDKYANNFAYSDETVPGCACPEGYLFEDLGGSQQCVPKSSCSCYDSSSGHFYAAGEQIKRACSTWFENFYYIKFIMKLIKFQFRPCIIYLDYIFYQSSSHEIGLY